ncbi:MAG: inosine/xanthosine triphosphatase [Candidatus Pacebacteria bacterium]|nr:inosine/xanthosine triphosphatase [Candidatus Paceibacterota bacterium]
MKIVVGSKNPVKLNAVKNAVKRIWPGSEILGVKTNSGVSNQPMTKKEAIKGALNRAKQSLENSNADMGVGLEGFVYQGDFGMFLSGWAVVVDRKGKIGIGGGGDVLLPEKVASEIRKGKELGFVMDKFIGEHNTKEKQGTVGILTNNLVSRTNSLKIATIFAFSRFINPDYYK